MRSPIEERLLRKRSLREERSLLQEERSLLKEQRSLLSEQRSTTCTFVLGRSQCRFAATSSPLQVVSLTPTVSRSVLQVRLFVVTALKGCAVAGIYIILSRKHGEYCDVMTV